MDNTYIEIIQAVLTTIVIPFLGILGVYLVKLISKKFDQINQAMNNEELKKYVDIAENLIIDSVIKTNQIFVDKLKEDGTFTAEDAAKALEMTKNEVLLLVTKASKDAVAELYGDFNQWLDLKIQSIVNQNKLNVIEAQRCIEK